MGACGLRSARLNGRLRIAGKARCFAVRLSSICFSPSFSPISGQRGRGHRKEDRRLRSSTDSRSGGARSSWLAARSCWRRWFWQDCDRRKLVRALP
eukprot:5962566-Pleurochrysis_carterae.AAC.1